LQVKIIKRKQLIKTLLVLTPIAIVLVAWANYRISSISKPFIYNNIQHIPPKQAALLLGTSKFLKDGQINQYYQNRILAVIELYKAGKIKYIIVSGDNSVTNYNEPLDMKNDLILLGVPDSLIYLDYAGFRTFDSVIRANKIFGQDKFIVISQLFHNERTIFIARHYNIEAFGYNAKDVTSYMGFRIHLREIFARAKVFLDLLVDKQPRFLGDKVKIG
jgi:SanA protein